jgi:hypothetical protein
MGFVELGFVELGFVELFFEDGGRRPAFLILG